ncbi:hypothetical protein ACIQAD_01645 [Streptomyces sp. NPDC088551]|uniref:hypothetical protein n=1 Tax=Streptomyces sp. NPDC088551 TaxID=3365863 RepID=UPI00382B6404
MTTERRTPASGPQDATQATPRETVGARESVAEGVRTAIGSDPQTADGRRPVAWLRITAPPSWQVTPSGHSWCVCGHDQRAIGRAAVVLLVQVHAEHRAVCLLLNPLEGSAAA